MQVPAKRRNKALIIDRLRHAPLRLVLLLLVVVALGSLLEHPSQPPSQKKNEHASSNHPHTPPSTTSTSASTHKNKVEPPFSYVSLRASFNASGEYTRKRYAFSNVVLTDSNTLHVALPSPAYRRLSPMFTDHHWVDIVHDNLTDAVLPSIATYRRSSKDQYSFQIQYSAGQPLQCARGWEERPVYVVFTPHHTNIWHILNDALIGAFQTLREEGLLPLLEIGDVGGGSRVSAYIEDVQQRHCPPPTDNSELPSTMPCLHAGYDDAGTTTYPCSLLKDGDLDEIASYVCNGRATNPRLNSLLVAANRTRGPILLLGKGSPVPPLKWMHWFKAVSADVREWDNMVGVCFRRLYLGKSTLLNLYINSVKAAANASVAATTLMTRYRSLRAFQRFLVSAEEMHGVAAGSMTYSYKDKELEELRQGIGPERRDALEVLRRRRHQAMVDELAGGKDMAELERVLEKERKNMHRVVEAHRSNTVDGVEITTEAGGIEYELPLIDVQSVPPHNHRRPVVTFLRRNLLRRCVLNEADILEYILSLYNVTVRVTHLEEPLGEVMQTMGDTDVVIGMHGAGWTNGLFLKPGAAAIQLIPYGWLAERNGSAPRPIRGDGYANIIRLLGGIYAHFVNTDANYAFMRPVDFEDEEEFAVHPLPSWPRPTDQRPGNRWIYQNTVVNMSVLGPLIDHVMRDKGVSGLLDGSVL